MASPGTYSVLGYGLEIPVVYYLHEPSPYVEKMKRKTLVEKLRVDGFLWIIKYTIKNY